MLPSPRLEMRISFLLFSLALFLSTFTLAQSIPPNPQTSSANSVVAENRVTANKATGKVNDNSYRIGVGDLLDVRVLNHPEMSRKSRVEGTGIIRMPYVGEVPATCLTE